MEITIWQCAACKRNIEQKRLKEMFSRTPGKPFCRKLKEIPELELNITVEGFEGDILICDKCVAKIEKILDTISTTVV